MIGRTARWLRLAMVAVTLVASGLTSYLAVHDHFGTGSAYHTVLTHFDGQPPDEHDASERSSDECSTDGCDQPSNSSHLAVDGHVHCCGSMAIAALQTELPVMVPVTPAWAGFEPSVPLGQRFYPLLRPPRAIS
jgi:hypothetical protein